MKCLQNQKQPGEKFRAKKCLFILVLPVSFYDTDGDKNVGLEKLLL